MKRMFQTQDRALDPRQIIGAGRIALASLAACFALCLLVLLGGYGLDNTTLRHFLPDWPAMVPQTAYSLGCLALAQLFARRPDSPRLMHRLALVFIGLALALAVIGIQHQMQPLPDPSVKRLSFNPFVTSSTGRMAPATIGGVFLMSLILLAQSGEALWMRRLHAGLASGGILLCLVAMAAYLFDAPALSQITFLSDMAFHTAGGFLLLYLAALSARPQGSWVPDLLADAAGGRMARRMLPLALVLPIILCFVALRSTEHGALSANLRLSTLAIALLLLACVAVLRGARYQNRAAMTALLEERRLREVLDGLDTAIFVLDRDGRLRMTNSAAEKMSGGDPAFLTKAQFHSMRNRAPLREAEHPVTRLLAAGRKQTIHCGWIDPEGGEHALGMSLSLTPKGEGFNDSLRILAIDDQTEGWILRENLSRTERLDAIGQMAGGVAHEMANILGAARLSVDALLLRPDQMPEGMQQKIEAIRSVCERGTDLTERLLNLTRDRAAEDEAFELNARLRDIAVLARQAVPAVIGFRLDLAAASLHVRCVPRDLESAVLNLVLNASQAIMGASGQGEIVLRSRAMPDGRVALSVHDNGPGMSAGLLAHVREPFYTTRDRQGGTGLGLPMVDNFARQAEAQFDLSSTEGQGTVASLLFSPVAEADLQRPPAKPHLPDLSAKRIVMVEDDPHFHDILAQSLQVLGAEVLSARSASEAQTIMARLGAAPDLLISDIMLPGGIDGYRLAAQCRAKWPELRVLYMSGYTDQLSRMGREVNGLLLRKPVTLDGLVNALALTFENPPGAMLAEAPA